MKNKIFDNIKIGSPIVKGFYVDNPQNRKLGRVGQPYDISTESKKEKLDIDLISDSVVDIAKKLKLSSSMINFIEENQDKLFFDDRDNKFHYYDDINLDITERNKELFNLGERIESKDKESHYLLFNKKDLAQQKIELFGDNQKDKYGISNIGFLNWLNVGINSKQLYESSKIYKKEELKDWEIQRIQEDKMLSIDNYYSLVKTLENLRIVPNPKTNRYEWNEDFVKNFEDFVVNSPRTDFYKMMKFKSPYIFVPLLKYRFLKKYNKDLIGSGWEIYGGRELLMEGKDKEFIEKRDTVINLANQLEYAIEDILKGDKDKLFINNPKVRRIYFADNDFTSCSYSEQEKSINVTKKFLDNEKHYFLSFKKYKGKNLTLLKEKYFVSSFLHELGHSLEYLVNKKELNSFANELGFDKNKDYTVFTNPIKSPNDKYFDNEGDSISNLKIKKDNLKELEKEFKDLWQKANTLYKVNDEGFREIFAKNTYTENTLNEVFITDYSTKSVSEGFAEYFSFYISNKEKIDKDITKYNKNKEEFCKNKDLGDYFKLHKVKSDFLKEEYKPFSYFIKDEFVDDTKAVEKYYEAIVNKNMKIFSLMKNMVDSIH